MFGNAIFIHNQVTHLPVHLLHHRAVDGRVIFHAGEMFGDAFIRIFPIWQIDIHDAIQQPQTADLVISAGVVNDRQPQTFIHHDDQRCEELRHDVGG